MNKNMTSHKKQKTMTMNRSHSHIAKALGLVLLGGMFLTSCTNDSSDEGSKTNDIITIRTSVAPQKRTPQLDGEGKGNFTQGDILSVFVGDDTRCLASTDYVFNTGVLTWSGLHLPEGTAHVTFASCYPKQTLTNDGTFEFNTSTASYKDLLLSKAQPVDVGTKDDVNLTFVHALHRLDISFTPGSGYTENDLKKLSLKCNARTTCVVDAVKGEISKVKDDKGDYTSAGTSASFFLVPQATADITLHINMNGEEQTKTLKQLLEKLGTPQDDLEGGKKCTITLSIGRDGITVSGGSISGWEDQVTADGEVTIG